MTDYAGVDFLIDQSLVPDPYPYYDYLREQWGGPVESVVALVVSVVLVVRPWGLLGRRLVR